MKRETAFALRESRFEKRIIPALHQPCEYKRLSWVIPGFQMVDFQRPFEESCRDLLKIWGVGFKAVSP